MTDERGEDESSQTFLPLQISIPTSSTVHGIRSAGHFDWSQGVQAVFDAAPAMLRYAGFMASLYLVRHGKASTTWEPGDVDPGLSELGRAQAEARAEQLAGKGPLTLLSSPLRRARETAAALERRWKTVATVDPRIGEIQAAGVAPEHRKQWLKTILQRRWRELGEPLERWRNDVLQALLGITQDTVVFSHFVAINVAVGHALGDDRVASFRPANCSCSLLEVQGKCLRIVELGVEQENGIL